jgi:glutaryl-CoA dehydrogenase
MIGRPAGPPAEANREESGAMDAFRGVDYYGIEALLTEEQRMVRDAVRDWVESKFLPVVAQHHRDGTFPIEVRKDLGELGVFGATLKGYGCAELDHVAYGLIMQELERGDSGLRSFASVQSGLVMYPIYAYGSDAQKDRWLPRLQSGEALGCFGLTEPDHGSDPGSMATRAVRRGNEYVLNGTKLWITNGSVADVAVVWAKSDDGEIEGFLVERNTPGFSTLDIHGKFSMRASITSELSFQDCRIPADNRLPKVRGLRGPLGCLNQARYGIAWGAIGAAMAVYDWARQYACQRVQFGRPIASFQLVQQKLVWMLTEITKAQLLCLRLGQLKNAGELRPQQVSLAKMNNVQMALDAARMARDILGAAGIVDEHPVIRHMLNLETVNTYEGTHDIHVLIIGRDITGLDAFGG